MDGIGQFISEILTPEFLVNWATMAVSLFNIIVLLWLGLTVVLALLSALAIFAAEG